MTVRVLAGRILAIAIAVWLCGEAPADSRGAKIPSGEPQERRVEPFDPGQSAALFVGVREFTYDTTLAEVRYAVDDAVDLAFVLALDERVRLIEPGRVVLALSGKPQKRESQHNLDRLIAAGAKVRPAAQGDVLTALDEQARAAGRNGLLVIAFATHGVSFDGTQYLLMASSVLRHRETTLSESKIRDIASRSEAARSLVLIDACRERLVEDQRNGAPDVRSAASLFRAMADVHGQVVLSAAAAGQYAYDDDSRGNGVFTAAVIDGLRCEAVSGKHGLVTIEALAAFVEQRVLSWIRKHRRADVTRATQVTWEGGARTMPLATCDRTAAVQASGCTISISSSPAGATVTLDGADAGTTPVSVRLAKDQRGEVVLVKSGYRAATATVDCSQSKPLFITLLPRPAGQQVLLSETFDDNRRKWYESTDRDAPAEVNEGAYLFGSKPSAFRFATTLVEVDETADFQIAVTVRRLRGDQTAYCGLAWGLANGSNFFAFLVNGRGNISVGMVEYGGPTPLNDTTVVYPSVRTKDSPNRLKVSKTGDRLQLFVNDALVHELPHRPFFGSGIGVIAIYGPIVAAFDDLEVIGTVRQ